MEQSSNQIINVSDNHSWFDNFILKNPRVSIILIYSMVGILGFTLFYKLLPILLSAAPGLLENPHIYKMIFKYSWSTYYWCIGFISVLLHAIPLTIALGGISEWKKLISQNTINKEDIRRINKIRKKCNNIPYYVILTQVILPIIAVISFTIYNIQIGLYHIHILINELKLMLLFFSIFASMGIVSFIFAKRICRVILLNTDIDGSYPGFRVPFRNSLAMQMILMFIVGIMITSLAGYAKLVEEKGDLLLQINKKILTNYFDINKDYTVDEVKRKLQTIRLDDKSACTFYLGENGDEFTSDNSPLYDEYKIYLKHLAQNYNGKVHMGTGELQGASIKINTDHGPYYVGIKYLVVSKEMVKFFIISFIALLVLNGLIFFYFSHSISGDISIITDNLNKISEGETVDLDKRIPVVSNDETGDLVIAFNRIQKMAKDHIDYIKKSETIIREKERLASLGQLIGGIAHNLRTPIVSLAGGLEGLNGLVSEYDKSIDNASVSSKDHHAIADDMTTWIKKLKPYCSYMSDVITTIKEHSSVYNSHKIESFTIEELIKRIKILTDNELKQSGCTITFHTEEHNGNKVYGNITILLQVINNIILNAIEAYNNNGGTIDVFVNVNENDIEFQVRDYGVGIPEEIRGKIFHEMVTTKGGRGTGLGLYISMSRIISSFNGTMRFESSIGKGTSMYVTIPTGEKAPVTEKEVITA